MENRKGMQHADDNIWGFFHTQRNVICPVNRESTKRDVLIVFRLRAGDCQKICSWTCLDAFKLRCPLTKTVLNWLSRLWSLQLFLSYCLGLSDLSRQALTIYQWLRLCSPFLKWQIFDGQTITHQIKSNQCEQFLPTPLSQRAGKKSQACPDHLISQEYVPQDVAW